MMPVRTNNWLSQAAPYPGLPGRALRQEGAVLVVSLILLVVLTLLGLSSMNMTSLEEKMAANMQESVKALHAAESGLLYVLDAPNGIPSDLQGVAQQTGIPLASSAASFDYETRFLQRTRPPAGSLYSAENFQAFHFDVKATGTTAAGATVVVNGGMYQIAPKGL